MLSRRYGLSGALMSEEEYLAMQGGGEDAEPFEFLPEPGDVPAVGAHFPIWAHHNLEYQKERTALLNLTDAFVTSLDAGSLALVVEGDRGTRHRTLNWMFARLQREYGTITPIELSTATASLRQPFIAGTFRDHLLRHREVHRIAQASGSAFAEAFMVDMLRGSVADHVGLTVPVQVFFAANPTIQQQTFDRFATALQLAHDTSPGTATNLGYVAATTEDNVLKRIQQAVREDRERRNNNSGTRTKFYCWTHGENFTHRGNKCRFPGPGHQEGATKDNKIGGR